MSVAYAKERFTFGRAIGCYQAMKHGLVEILRRQENARSLLIYAGFAFSDAPGRDRATRRARRARSPAARWTSPRASRSPCTAASARRGSTTRR